MAKKNCWEFKKCGRGPGGGQVTELGTCQAAIEFSVDGTNSGRNGGRACWMIAGTFCQGAIQGTFAEKIRDCLRCEFFWLVREEEGRYYEGSLPILTKLGKEESVS